MKLTEIFPCSGCDLVRIAANHCERQVTPAWAAGVPLLVGALSRFAAVWRGLARFGAVLEVLIGVSRC